MQMEEGLDTGPMLRDAQTLDIRGKNAGQVTEELAELGARLLVEWLDAARRPPEAAADDGATYAAKIDKAEARIDWTQPAAEIERQVRAFAPSPGAWFEANGERIKLLEAASRSTASGEPGEVLDDALTIACGDGSDPPAQGPARRPRADDAERAAARLRRFPTGTILP